METNPHQRGVLTEHGVGIGAVTRSMIRDRAFEIARINGHAEQDATRADWEEAQRELSGGPTVSPETILLESVPESERWEMVPGSAGRQAAESANDEENEEGLSEEAQLFEEGVNEATHDQMLQAARAVRHPDELSS